MFWRPSDKKVSKILKNGVIKMKNKVVQKILLGIVLTLIIVPNIIIASTEADFYVDRNYDLKNREKAESVLIDQSTRAYFYVDSVWWEELDRERKNEVRDQLEDLGEEFDDKIYPSLTSTYGSEWKPGIDNDSRITILFHPMIGNAGGYFRPLNEYERIQVPTSNEREMFYVNSDYLGDQYVRSLLAHELTHLITFNQKEKKHNVSEEVWLNEARAEYAPTLLGYDEEYNGSNLQRRARIFLENPSNSIINWGEEEADYGALNLFTQYLTQHYGYEILVDSLQSAETGRISINKALENNNIKKTFGDIFTDWTIAVYINDCSVGNKYCYLNNNLSKVKVISKTNFLPLQGKSSLSSTDQVENWSAQWVRFIGGDGDLKLKFVGNEDAEFKIPYVIESRSREMEVKFLDIDHNQKGVLSINEFSEKKNSLTLIPSVQINDVEEDSFPIYWEVQTMPNNPEEERRQELINQIISLQEQIKKLQAQIVNQKA